MAMAASVNPATPVLYMHPGLKLVQYPGRGFGYKATRTIKRGELLLEEMPFVWDSGRDPSKPDLSLGAEWLIRTGAIDDLLCPPGDYLTPEERAEGIAGINSFRNGSPCADGSYAAFLFRHTSRFNHSCFPNAGGYLPGEQDFAEVATCVRQTMRTFAIEGISGGEEVCICYLGVGDQLSPTQSRQAALQSWGFKCSCRRCRDGNPLDAKLREAKLETFSNEVEKRQAIEQANREFRALFDPSAKEYDPPAGDFQTVVERLSTFHKRNIFLEPANMVMQRVRRELLAALLIGGVESEIGRKFAGMVAALLLEELHVFNAMLPGLSPCKAPIYAQFHKVLKNVPQEEAVWLEKESKIDGMDLLARGALWLHDPPEFCRLGLEGPKNLPPLPLPGPPPRRGPEPAAGSCCMPGLKLGEPLLYRPTVLSRCGRRCSWSRGVRSTRRIAVAAEVLLESGDDMPMILSPPGELGGCSDVLKECKPLNLWEAYAEYGRPTAAARSLQENVFGKVREVKTSNTSWFKFKK